MYTDSHAHLTSPELYPQIDEVLLNAQKAGIGKIVNICTEKAEVEKGLELAAKYPWVTQAAAVHPHDVEKEGQPYFDFVQQCAEQKKLVAIGETGLDYYYMRAPREVQQEFFKKHLQLAIKHHLPVIIHCRDAFTDLFPILDSDHKQQSPLILHCFTGTLVDARHVLDRGGYISFSGVVTFKKSEALREVIKIVPLDKLLIETDAPYLAPQSHRGKINQPAFIVETAEMVAVMKGVSPQEIALTTTRNASHLFKF